MPQLPPRKPNQRWNKPKQYSEGPHVKLYHSKAWRTLRERKMRENPICEHCEKVGLLTSAQMVDHIKPVSEGGEFWSMANLQSLCNQCHAIKTGKETNKRRYNEN